MAKMQRLVTRSPFGILYLIQIMQDLWLEIESMEY